MTEDEAKTKWCPMLQVSAGAGVMGTVSNRSNAYDDNSDRHGRCIGSACMAFRQHGWRDKEDGQIKSMAYDRAEPQFWEPMFHCGLAGRP